MLIACAQCFSRLSAHLPFLQAAEMLFCRLQQHIQSTFAHVDVIVGLDSRGFLLGPILATRLGCAFVPIRKGGKLPGQCQRVEYSKEYGKVQKGEGKRRAHVANVTCHSMRCDVVRVMMRRDVRLS